MQAFGAGVGYTLLYIVVCLIPALLIRWLTPIKREAFRKLLHMIAQSLILCFVYGFTLWYHAVIFCVIFAAAFYPVLSALERLPLYTALLNERKTGEVKNSLIVVFLMYAVLLTVCWGFLNDRLLAVASVFAWGFGDAAAALVGQAWGKHKIAGSKKSWEGTLAMFGVSVVCVLAVLLLRGGLTVPACLLAAAVTAAVSAAVELYTPGGYDTITCPTSAMLVLMGMLHLLGGAL